jgi:transcriptional regulator with XRE-family HTH domain
MTDPDAQTRRAIVAALVDLRHALGVPQVELARRMHIVQATLSRIEHGDDPKVSTLQRYARALGIQFTIELQKQKADDDE